MSQLIGKFDQLYPARQPFINVMVEQSGSVDEKC